jgi:aspartate ammonia-lyase
MSEFLQFSSALKELAVELSIVCRNLCTSCSKFNSSLETHESKRGRESKHSDDKHTLKRMTNLIALASCQVTANDSAIAQCCQVTEVPASIPFAVNALLQSLDLLRSALGHFNLQCAAEITP